MEAVRARHPYEVPAILVLPVEGGLAAYLSWIGAEVAAPPALEVEAPRCRARPARQYPGASRPGCSEARRRP